MKQLNYSAADAFARAAALDAIGFGPLSGTVTVDADEVRRVAHRAAMIALEKAGFLREQNAADQRWIASEADKADRIHREVCKNLGIPF